MAIDKPDFASLNARSKWARSILLGYAIISLAVMISGGAAILLFGREGAPPVLTLANGYLSLFSGVLFLLGAVLVPMWVHRAHANLRAMRLEELSFSPTWAAVSFFAPIAGLFVPFQAMRELFNRSHGEPAHFAKTSAPAVTNWWTCFITSNLIQTWLVMTLSLGPATGVHVVTPPAFIFGLGLFAGVLGSAAAWFLMRLVAAITLAQQSSMGVAETFA